MRLNRPLLLRPALLAAAATISLGCHSVLLDKILDPKIELAQLALRSIGFTGGTLDVTFSFDNPNDFEVKGTRLEAGLDVEGIHFGDLVLDDTYTLTKSGVTQLTVPLNFTWKGVGAAAKAALGYGSVQYQIKGRALLQTPVGTEVSVPFTRTGSAAMFDRTKPPPS